MEPQQNQETILREQQEKLAKVLLILEQQAPDQIDDFLKIFGVTADALPKLKAITHADQKALGKFTATAAALAPKAEEAIPGAGLNAMLALRSSKPKRK